MNYFENELLPEYYLITNTKILGVRNLNRAKTNYLIDLFLTMVFFVVAGTGLFMYFFIPSGIPRGRYVVYMGLTKGTWIWIHSRAGIVIVLLVIVHLILHWRWIVCTTKGFFKKRVKDSVCELNSTSEFT